MPAPVGAVKKGDYLIYDGAVFSAVIFDADEDGTTENVTSMFAVGGITNGQLIPIGTTLTDFVKKILLTVYNPTFVAPTFSISTGQANGQEIGTVIPTLTITGTQNRG